MQIREPFLKRALLVLPLVALGLVSCSEKEAPSQTEEEDEFVSVGLNLRTENVELVSEVPLTRAGENNKMYGIRIEEYEDFDRDQYDRHPYCYALFDDIQNVIVKFRKNKHYFITIDYFPNGKNEIGFSGTEYGCPFQRFPSSPHYSPIPFNEIIYDTDDTMYCLGSSMLHPKPSTAYSAQTYSLDCHFERYIYMDWNFVPSDDSTLDITLLRAQGGFKFVFEKVEGFDYSNVVVRISETNYTIDVTKNSVLEISDLTMGGSTLPFEPECRELEANVSIGTAQNKTEIFNGKLNVKRNILQTFSVKLKPADTTTNPLNIMNESGGMTNEEGGVLNGE